MFQRRPKRFRRRSNGRNHSSRMNGGKDNLRINLFPSDKHRNNNFRSSHNAEKMFEKYTSLAKEALSSGDKTLHENYLQHADHFMRLVADKKKLQALNQTNLSNQTNPPENNLAKEVSNSPKENTNNEK
mgnify:FL=1|tara:strand:+ start:1014 stop:1400 length:387 start_codon:yes stop_codon:yes gene_type:complete